MRASKESRGSTATPGKRVHQRIPYQKFHPVPHPPFRLRKCCGKQGVRRFSKEGFDDVLTKQGTPAEPENYAIKRVRHASIALLIEENQNVNLSAPTNIVFIIAVIIAIVAALAALGVVSFIPIASVWIMAAAFVVLMIGCLFKGT